MFYRHIFTDNEATTAADGTRAYHVEIPFKDIAQAWTDQGGSGDVIAHPYLLAWDYGLNHSEAVTIDLPSDNEGPIAPCVSPTGGHWAHGLPLAGGTPVRAARTTSRVAGSRSTAPTTSSDHPAT